MSGSTTFKTHRDICQKPAQQSADEWDQHSVAIEVAMGFLGVTVLIYLYNIVVSLYQAWRAWSDTTASAADRTRATKFERPEFDSNVLSGVLGSAFGVIIIFAADWPQPLEAATLLVSVLVQVSLIGWQDIDPLYPAKTLVNKSLDVAAVVITILALFFARHVYTLAYPEYAWKGEDDPLYLIHRLWAVTVTGFAVGLFQQVFIFIAEWISKKGDQTASEQQQSGSAQGNTQAGLGGIRLRNLSSNGDGSKTQASSDEDDSQAGHEGAQDTQSNRRRTQVEEKWKKWTMITSSIAFIVLQTCLLAFAAIFTSATLSDGCAVFNAAKILSISICGVGWIYSFTILVVRVVMHPQVRKR